MFREILHHRFWTLVLFLIALGGVATAMFELDDLRREQSASWEWETSALPRSLVYTAYAESGVRVRVEVPEATFADELIPVRADSCTITDTAGRTQKYPGRSAICVFDEASRTAGFTYDIVLYGYQGLITRLAQNGVEARTLIWFLINNEFPESGDCHPMYGVSISTCPLVDGDELFVFSDDDSIYPPLALALADDDVLINERVRVTVTDARTGGAVSGASVRFGETTVQTDGNGEAMFSSLQGETLQVYAEKDHYLRSRRLPLRIQDVAAVEVNMEERTDVEQDRIVRVSTTMLDETFLDHATVLGAILRYCEEESYVCRANDAGDLIEFRGIVGSDVVVTKNESVVTDLLDSVVAETRVRVALPKPDEPAPPVTPPDPSSPPSSPPPPPSEPPSSDSTPPDSSLPSDDTLEPGENAPMVLDPLPTILPTTPAPDPSESETNHSDRKNTTRDNVDDTGDDKEEDFRDEKSAQDTNARTPLNVNTRIAVAQSGIGVLKQNADELQGQESLEEQGNIYAALPSDSVDDRRQEQENGGAPMVLGAATEQTHALWLVVLLVVSSGVAGVTGIRLLRCVASRVRSA